MVHTQGGAHKRRSIATAGVLLFKGPQAGRYTQKAVYTQGGAQGGGGFGALTRRTGGGGGEFGANEAHGGGEFGVNKAHGRGLALTRRTGGGGGLALTRRVGGVWR